MKPEANNNQLNEEKQVTEVTDDIKTTGLCDSRRHISDLDSRDPKTGFPTKWISDHSSYDSQVTVSDNKGNYTDSSETGNVRAINTKED